MAEQQQIDALEQAGEGAAALSRLPHGALPQALAQCWLQHWQAGAGTRAREPVLVDTLDILASLNADPEVMANRSRCGRAKKPSPAITMA